MFKKRISSIRVNADAPFNCTWWAEQSGKSGTSKQRIFAHLRRLEAKGKVFKYAENPDAIVQFFPTADTTINEIINELTRI